MSLIESPVLQFSPLIGSDKIEGSGGVGSDPLEQPNKINNISKKKYFLKMMTIHAL